MRSSQRHRAVQNRDFLAPFDPIREDGFFVADGQRALLEQLEPDRERGTAQWWAIETDGALVGRITLTDNVASQRLLERQGFTRIGIAPAYLRIAGRWQDHLLSQRIAPVGHGADADA